LDDGSLVVKSGTLEHVKNKLKKRKGENNRYNKGLPITCLVCSWKWVTMTIFLKYQGNTKNNVLENPPPTYRRGALPDLRINPYGGYYVTNGCSNQANLLHLVTEKNIPKPNIYLVVEPTYLKNISR